MVERWFILSEEEALRLKEEIFTRNAETRWKLYGILTLTILYNFFEIYLRLRQIKVFRTTKVTPDELKNHLDESAFQKARAYGYHQQVFEIIRTLLLNVVIACLELSCGVIPYVFAGSVYVVALLGLDAKNEIIVSIFFAVIYKTFCAIKNIPFLIYKILWLEKEHGLNKQSPAFLVRDQLKSFIVSQVIMMPLVALVVFIVQFGGDFIVLILWYVDWNIIIELFWKYTPLPDGELRQKIKELAASVEFPLSEVYIVSGSKKPAHRKVYLRGKGTSRSIVLYDTLLLNRGQEDDSGLKVKEKGKILSNEEVVALVAHVLGHWYYNHNAGSSIIYIVLEYLPVKLFFSSFHNAALYAAIGFRPHSRPIVVGLGVVYAYLLKPYDDVSFFAMSKSSRDSEYQADEYAHKRGYSTELSRALVKLESEKVGFPVHDSMCTSWNYYHPTLLQRLARLKELNAEQGTAAAQKKTN